MAKRSIEEKLNILKLSDEIGVVKAAQFYNINRKTISRWRNLFKVSGETGLERKVGEGGKHPQTVKGSIKDKIIELKRCKPHYSGEKIKRELDLKITRATICKIIRENLSTNQDNTIKLFDKTNLPPLNSFLISTQRVAKNLVENSHITYQIELLDISTKLSFISFCDQNLLLGIKNFLNYFLSRLDTLKIKNPPIYIYYRFNTKKHLDLISKGLSNYKIEVINIGKQYREYNKRFKDYLFNSRTRQLSQLTKRGVYTDLNDLCRSIFFQLLNHNYKISLNYRSLGSSSCKRLIYYNYPIHFTIHSHISSIVKEMIPNRLISDLIEQFNSLDDRINNLKKVLDRRNLINSSIKLHTQLIEDIEDGEIIFSLRRNYINLKLISGDLRDNSEGFKKREMEYLQSYRLSKQLQLDQLTILSSSKLGDLYEKEGKIDRSIWYLNNQIKIAKKVNLFELQIEGLIDLAILYDNIGKRSLALKKVREAYSFSKLIENRELIFKSNTNIGIIHYHNFKHNLAIKYFRKSLDYTDNLVTKTKLKVNIGLCLTKQNRFIEALKLLEESYIVAKEISDNEWQLSILVNISSIKLELGEYGYIFTIAPIMISLALKSREYILLSVMYRIISDGYKIMGNLDKAREFIEDSIRYAKRKGAVDLLGIGFYRKGEILFREGEYRRSITYADKALSVISEIEKNRTPLLYVKLLQYKNYFQIFLKTKKRKEQNLLHLLEEISNLRKGETDQINLINIDYELLQIFYQIYQANISLNIDIKQRFNDLKSTILKDAKKVYKVSKIRRFYQIIEDVSGKEI